ncbi:aldo/keto reductase [Virgibacillus xinjiangensis]|uniref:Aldo/keto reductase n=1 Tax=Virgibacillus xinjiangensis TaxID=393090 RepID=A0ABV7CRE8_9BACI
MRKRQLGTSGIYVSEMTLGCMSLGTELSKATDMIDTALDAGINHLDTADLYDFGRNEEIVGKAIQDKRDQVILTSKVGNHFNREQQDWFWDPSKHHIKNGLKESLRRLHTDYIDFYMLHGGTIDDPIDESIEAFEELKKEGLIRAYGISSIRPNVIREYVRRADIDAVMMQYNLLDRRPEEEILDLLHSNSISVLARGPLAKGILTDQSTEKIEEKANKGYLDYSYEELREIQELLKNTLPGSLPIQEAAFNYILKHPAVASVVFGASSKEQIMKNITLEISELPKDIYTRLQEITKPVEYTNHR